MNNMKRQRQSSKSPSSPSTVVNMAFLIMVLLLPTDIAVDSRRSMVASAFLVSNKNPTPLKASSYYGSKSRKKLLPHATKKNKNDDDDNRIIDKDTIQDNEFASDIENEWGIPYSKSLTPLNIPTKGSKPLKQLPNGGKVTLVGSGPGDPDLLTVSAYKLLTEDDDSSTKKLIISDRLVSNEILNIISKNSEVKVARKLPGCQNLAQEEIYYWIYQGLAAGKHVIRLKIGDPFVFGRGGEEILTIRQFANIEPKVIPGVSAAFSAPLLGGIPVTHRGISNQVVMCTGYGRDNTSPDLIQYHKEQTIVFLMAVGRLRTLCDRLVSLANYPSETPVGIIENAGCPNQRTIVGTIQTIPDIAQEHNIKPPSTIVVGDVVNVLLFNDDNGEEGNDEDNDVNNNDVATTRKQITGLIQNYTESAILQQ